MNRLIQAMVVLIVGTGVVAIAADPSTRPATTQASSLDAYRAALKARGEPATAADLVRPAVPEKENAAEFLKQAMAAIDKDHAGPRASDLVYGPELPYGPAWDRMAEEMMQANPHVLELAHQARACTKVNWGTRFDLPVEQMLDAELPLLNRCRALANLIADAALYHHFRGDDAAALDAVEDALALGDARGDHPLLVSHLVAMGIHGLSLQDVQILAATMVVQKAGPATQAAAGAAPRRQVERLIARLLDDRAAREQCRNALRTERVLTLDQLERLAGQPEAEIDVQQLMGVFDELIAEMAQPRLMDRSAARQPDPLKPLDPMELRPHYARVLHLVYRLIWYQRAAAVGLAVRLYWTDHGQYPASLKDMVPAYLPAVPEDPLAKAPRPVGYLLAQGGKRPMVWSVGPDGEPQTGDQTALPEHPNYGWRASPPGDVDDQWIDLSPWRKQ